MCLIVMKIKHLNVPKIGLIIISLQASNYKLYIFSFWILGWNVTFLASFHETHSASICGLCVTSHSPLKQPVALKNKISYKCRCEFYARHKSGSVGSQWRPAVSGSSLYQDAFLFPCRPTEQTNDTDQLCWPSDGKVTLSQGWWGHITMHFYSIKP